MENTTPPSTWERSTTRRFLRWLCSRQFWIGAAWLVSLIALAYGIIDWHDRREWNAYRDNYEAHVASLDLPAYTPKPIPDSENFAATPFVASWLLTGTNYDTNFLYDHDAYSQADKLMGAPPSPPKGARHENHFQNLAAWQEAFAAARAHAKGPQRGFWPTNPDLTSRAQAAPAILDALKDDQAAFDELRAASARPECRYPVVYNMDNPWAILLPHLGRIKATCRRLSLKACAELAVGQDENALDDIKLMLYLGDSPKSEPFLISYLVRLACLHITMQPISEGLAEHRWNDAQLEQLQGRLVSYNFLADMERPLHAERAAGVYTEDLLKKNGLGFLADLVNSTIEPPSENKPLLNLMGRVMPAGWYDLDKLNYCLHCDDLFRGAMDAGEKRVFPGQIEENAAKINEIALDNGLFQLGTSRHGTWHTIIHHEILATILAPGLARIPIKAAEAQIANDQAYVACALERYRLANGQYPETLDSLAPRFAARLPDDVITGEPFKYRRTDDGRFVLYSVGWNEKDDGGVPGKTLFDESEGDWVWPYP